MRTEHRFYWTLNRQLPEELIQHHTGPIDAEVIECYTQKVTSENHFIFNVHFFEMLEINVSL